MGFDAEMKKRVKLKKMQKKKLLHIVLLLLVLVCDCVFFSFFLSLFLKVNGCECVERESERQ